MIRMLLVGYCLGIRSERRLWEDVHLNLAYAANYLIDTDHAVIVDVEATRAIRQAETGAARTMIDRSMDRFGLWPEALIAVSSFISQCRPTSTRKISSDFRRNLHLAPSSRR
jgi:hypothetical protein